ncbi:PhzF family phenazine biosynthesis protein [Mucilaginibacter sp. X4EP1]|uniref:PhzF family phenazine biosynthesis protein n=1 Tax=Mucilaginibacter sp. X4EP1 TaxID=2723092 RepID=UPI002169853B|nr:PhzF family phenazine biosynthesis protein [Mucilaginibacter sp. X4EP1]MCS3811510.1 PhzF family phenazine biosynthesis protein [Mucilaginibacter sp. X4EP1]
MKQLTYHHVDVFSDKPFSGNGLTVFLETENIFSELMLTITQEMRQFESIFLQNFDGKQVTARVFTSEEELDFAGHPVLGAAAVLHELYARDSYVATWEFALNTKTVNVTTELNGSAYECWMNQGVAEFGVELPQAASMQLLKAMNLSEGDLYPGYLPSVVSTGLPYVLIPTQQNSDLAKISIPDLEIFLAGFGAKFIGILDIPSLSIRTWDNAGTVEDIATGSLAGPCGAFLVKNKLQAAGDTIILKQGHNLGRPSRLLVRIDETNCVHVGGHVCKIGSGSLNLDV